MTLFAQAATDTNVQDLLWKGGPFAFVVALAVAGKVRFKPEVDGLLDDKRRLDAQVAALTEQFQRIVIPTMNDTVVAMRDMTKAVEASTAGSARVEQRLGSFEQTRRRGDRPPT